MRTARLDYRPGDGPAPVSFNRPALRPTAPALPLPDWRRALTDLVTAQGPSRTAATLGITRVSLWRYTKNLRQPNAAMQQTIVNAWAYARGLTC